MSASVRRVAVRPQWPASLRAVVLVAALAPLGACEWFTDFKRQPKIDPWESPNDTIPPRGNPQFSVPVYGSTAPGLTYDRAPTPAAALPPRAERR